MECVISYSLAFSLAASTKLLGSFNPTTLVRNAGCIERSLGITELKKLAVELTGHQLRTQELEYPYL